MLKPLSNKTEGRMRGSPLPGTPFWEEKGVELARRILVVEDEEPIRELMDAVLTRAGYRVTTADNGLEGWEVFRRGSFDLVLTDLIMPGMKGSVLAEKIKRLSPEIPIAMVTGSDLEEAKSQVKQGVVDRILPKPFTLQGLEALVEELLTNTL